MKIFLTFFSSPSPVGLNTIKTEADKQATWTAKSVQVLIPPERKKKKVIFSELRRNPRVESDIL